MEGIVNGKWWLPGMEREQIDGYLNLEQQHEITLELNGAFKDWSELTEFSRYDIILGVSSDGKLVTLYKCYESNSRISMPGYARTSFEVSCIFEGHHFESEGQLSFDRYYVSFSNLDNWARISGFKVLQQYDENKYLSKYTVEYSVPEDTRFTEVDGVSIGLHYRFNSNVNIVSGIRMTQSTFFKISKNESTIAFQDFMRVYLYNLQNFLSLVVGETVYPITIMGGINALDEVLEDGRNSKKNISIILPKPSYQGEGKEIQTFQMNFPYDSIKEDVGTMLHNWFQKSDVLLPIYDLYFGTLYHSTMYLQQRFLSIAQGIESYHRRVFGGTYLPDDQADSLTSKIVSVIKDELTGDIRNTFINKLSHLNTFSLRTRLKWLIKLHYDFIAPIFEADKTFVDAVVTTRNYLTHFDESQSAKAKRGVELYIVTEQLKFILEVCLFTELGVSKEKMMKHIGQGHNYVYLKSLCKE